jgi:aspartate 1-decarboxylase
MKRTYLLGKIHRARVTHCELNYEGSCAIDEDLLEASGIGVFERVDIYNVTNGERFTTYSIRGERGSGMISLNGGAARKAAVGDLIIIAAYCDLEHNEIRDHKPSLVFVDEKNRQVGARQHIPTQRMDQRAPEQVEEPA